MSEGDKMEGSLINFIDDLINNINDMEPSQITEKLQYIKNEVIDLLEADNMPTNNMDEEFKAPELPTPCVFLPPPPPPPAPGMNANVICRKPKIETKSPMKPLFWKRIQVPVDQGNNSPNGNLWEKLEETPLNIDEFDALFSKNQPKAQEDVEDDEHTEEKPDYKTFLDAKRSQNVGIFVKSKKLDIKKLSDSIYNFDDTIIDIDTLKQIDELQATDEELHMMELHLAKNEDIPLDAPDQFLYALSGIDNFNDRLDCFVFQKKFADKLGEIEIRLNELKRVCEMLVNNDSVNEVFR